MDNKNPGTVVTISTTTFIKVLIIFLILVFLFLIKGVLALIFISIVLASAFDPWVDWFHKYKIPRSLGILIIYIVMLSIVATALILIIPPITKEIGQIATHFPDYYEKIVSGLNSLQGGASEGMQNDLQQGLMSLSQNLNLALNNIFSFIFNFFGGMLSFFLVLVITFYLTLEEENLKNFLRSVTPAKYQPYMAQTMFKIQRKMGQWLRGQIILSLIIFVLTFIGLTIIGVPYALVLAFIAGILEIVPFIGPTLSAIPALFFAFLLSPVTGLLVAGLYIIIQQLENHLITPRVMGKSVDLNPLVIIVVILIGAQVGGIVGAIISVPVATALSVFVKDFLDRKSQKEGQLEE